MINKLILPHFFACSIALGQNSNLLPNGSFEKLSKCPESVGDIELAEGWHNGGLTPDLFSSCTKEKNNGLNVPDNYVGSITPYDGNSYAGVFLYTKRRRWSRRKNFMASESIWTKLEKPITKGKRYRLTIFVSLADSSVFFSNYLVASFSQAPVGVVLESKNKYFDIVYYNKNLSSNKWTMLSYEFSPLYTFNYLSIGMPRRMLRVSEYNRFIKNMKLPNKRHEFGDCYYYLDDIVLQEVPGFAE